VSASRRQSIRYPSHRNDDPTLNNENQLSFKLNVLPLEHPAFINSNLVSDSQKDGQPLIVEQPEDGAELICRVAGRPWPSINWYLNGKKLKPTLNNSRVQITDEHQVVRISYVTSKDEGVYECEAENKLGSIRILRLVQLRSTIETHQIYDQLSIPVIVAVVIAVFLVILLIIIAKLCYSRRSKANSSITTSTCPWKDPPTPPTPKLTQFELPLATTPSPPSSQISQLQEQRSALLSPHPPPCPGSSLSTGEDDECRVTLAASLRDDYNSSPFDSLHRGQHIGQYGLIGGRQTPACSATATAHSTLHPSYCSNTIYSHCHYQALPPIHTPAAPLDPLLPCQTSSLCECSLQTIPQGTLERQFPHLYSRNNGTLLHNSNIYDTGRGVRSQSLSPSDRRSAEY